MSHKNIAAAKKAPQRTMPRERRKHPIGRALVLVVGLLLVLPALFAEYVLGNGLRDQNLCYVGPTPGAVSSPLENLSHSSPHTVRLLQEIRSQMLDLYGTYTTFDDASYYFVKAPYKIHPQCLPGYGWWSVTTLSLTLLAPHIRQRRQQSWKEQENSAIFDVRTSPSIQWDQTHRTPKPLPYPFETSGHSSQQNRWCIVHHHHQDLTQYQKYRVEPTDADVSRQQQHKGGNHDNVYRKHLFGIKAMKLTLQQQEEQEQLLDDQLQRGHYKICAPSQPSILADADQAPYFVELPLQPPSAGKWQQFESNSSPTTTTDKTRSTQLSLLSGQEIVQNLFDTEDPSDPYVRFRRSRGHIKPPNPFQVRVQCHVRDLELHHLAHGTLQPDAEPNLGWEHVSTLTVPVWNPLLLPGTVVVLVGLFLAQTTRIVNDAAARQRRQRRQGRRRQRQRKLSRPPVSMMDEEDVKPYLLLALQRQWYHESWALWAWSSLWVYVLGTGLEPLLGAIPFLGTGSVFWIWTAVFGPSEGFLWICFGWSVLLAHLLPSFEVGPMFEFVTLSLGDSEHALKINLLSVVIAMVPFRWTEQWKCGLGCLFFAWFLSHPLSIELLGAPQWTIPTLLMGHLYWKLTQIPLQDASKKDDEEMAVLVEVENEEDEESAVQSEDSYSTDLDDEDMSMASTAFSFVTDANSTFTQKAVKYLTTTSLYMLFGAWALLTIACFWTMDWTLVVGHVMTLWLCVGSTQFPRHPLWALYHMVSCCVLVVINVMTMVGWYMCQVAITTHALHALPPKIVAASMGVQTVAHFGALLHTTCTKQWSTSSSVPGHYLWDHIQIIGEEVRMWYYVFG